MAGNTNAHSFRWIGTSMSESSDRFSSSPSDAEEDVWRENEPSHEKRVIIALASIPGSDWPAHRCSLAIAFACCKHVVGTFGKLQTKGHVPSLFKESQVRHL